MSRRREEIGWRRGIWAAREWIPDGYAASIENAEIGADGSCRSVRGAAVVAEIAGKMLVHGASYVSRGGCKASILVADDGETFSLAAGASAPTVLGTIAPSSSYTSAQYFDNLYVATGSAPAVVRSAGSACVLSVGAAGLPAPPAPTLSFTSVSDPADPGQNLNRLALRPSASEIYGFHLSSTTFQRYNIADNTWTTLAPLPVPPKSFASLGAAADSARKIVYQPAGGYVGEDQQTRWYDPATNAWSINKPLEPDWHWFDSSEIYDGQAVFGAGDTWASVYHAAGSHRIGRIVELATTTRVLDSNDIGTGVVARNGEFVRFVLVPSGGTKYAYVLAFQKPSGPTRFRRVTLVGGGGWSVPLSTSGAPTPIYGDVMVWDPAQPDKIFLLRFGDKYWEYTISTDTWRQFTWPDGVTLAEGIVGGPPVNRMAYFFNPANTLDFRSTLLPGVPLGGFGSYRFQAQYRNATGRSSPSPVAQIDDVPDGATITASLPPAPAGATETMWYTNVSRDDLNTIGEYQITPAADTDITRPAEPVTVGSPPPPPTGGLTTIPHSKFVAAHEGRMWWGNIVGAGGSDVAFSLVGEPETVDPAARISFDPNDGDEITGLASLPVGLVVFKRRSVHVFVGDPGDPSASIAPSGFQRKISAGVGCAAPRSIGVTGDRAYFVAEKGVYATDGRGVLRISDAIEDLLPAPPDAACAFVDARGRYLVSLDGSSFHVFDPVAGRWEARLTFEAQRTAAVVAGFGRNDLGERYALAGARMIRFGHAGDPVSVTDPFRLKAGPHGAGIFEDDVAVLFVWLRYRGGISLIWESDVSAAPEAERTIALPSYAATGTAMTRVPTTCSGRRIFLEARSAGSAPVLLEALSLEVQPLRRLVGAP